MTIKIEWTGSKGNALAVEIVDSSTPGYSRATARPYVDGKRAGEDGLIERAASTSLQRLPANILAVVGKIAITDPAILTQIKTAIDGLQAQIDIRPDTIARRLRQQRESLSATRGYIVAAWDEERQRNIERASATGIMRAESRNYTAEHAQATAALAEFDAAHPEVKAAIDRARAERTEEWLRNGN